MTKEKEPEALRRPRHAGRPTEDAAPAGRRGSCDEKPTVRRAPPSHEKSSVAIVERKGQSYEAAALRRERSRASFGTDNLADWERFLARAEALVPLSQVELSAYAQMKLVLADYALRILSGRVKPADKKDLPKPDELYRAATPEGLDAVRRRILEGVRFYRKRSAKRAGKLPEGDAKREDFERMLDARAADELLHTGDIPWDAAEDGHFLGRAAAWRLGIVRWARQIAPERAERISDALCRTEVHHAGTLDGRLCWEDGRPLLFLSEWTLLTVKLVHEAWLHDPRIVVVNTGKPLGRNPFAPFRLGFLEDVHGHVSALLGVTQTPVLVEPRFASVTYTAATGWLDLTKADALRVPSFFRTMAEAAFLAEVSRDLEKTSITELSRSSVLRLATARTTFEAILKTAMTEPRAAPDPVLKDLLRKNREALIALHERVLAFLAAAETRARRAKARSVRLRAAVLCDARKNGPGENP